MRPGRAPAARVRRGLPGRAASSSCVRTDAARGSTTTRRDAIVALHDGTRLARASGPDAVARRRPRRRRRRARRRCWSPDRRRAARRRRRAGSRPAEAVRARTIGGARRPSRPARRAELRARRRRSRGEQPDVGPERAPDSRAGRHRQHPNPSRNPAPHPSRWLARRGPATSDLTLPPPPAPSEPPRPPSPVARGRPEPAPARTRAARPDRRRAVAPAAAARHPDAAPARRAPPGAAGPADARRDRHRASTRPLPCRRPPTPAELPRAHAQPEAAGRRRHPSPAPASERPDPRRHDRPRRRCPRADDDLDRPAGARRALPGRPPDAAARRHAAGSAGARSRRSSRSTTPRPPLGVLRLSTGDVVTLDRGVLLGRAPQVNDGACQPTERPHVVRVPSPERDISRNHVEVVARGLARAGARPRHDQRHHGRPCPARSRCGCGAERPAGPRARHRRVTLADEVVLHLRGRRSERRRRAPRSPGLVYVQPLGSGGYADVFLYEQQSPRMPVAVKVLKSRGPDRRASDGSSSTRPTRWPSSATTPTSSRSSAPAPPPTAALPRHEVLPAAEPRGAGARPSASPSRRCCAPASSWRAPSRPRTGPASSTATSSRPTCSSASYGAPGLTDFGIAGRGGARRVTLDEDDDVGVSVPWAPPEVLYGQSQRRRALATSTRSPPPSGSCSSGARRSRCPGGDNSAYALMPRIRASPVPPTGRRRRARSRSSGCSRRRWPRTPRRDRRRRSSSPARCRRSSRSSACRAPRSSCSTSRASTRARRASAAARPGDADRGPHPRTQPQDRRSRSGRSPRAAPVAPPSPADLDDGVRRRISGRVPTPRLRRLAAVLVASAAGRRRWCGP